MKSLKVAILVWMGSVILLIGSVLISEPNMPDRIATHFDSSGQPNGWMSRSLDTAFFLGSGVGISVFIIGLIYSFRFFPSSTLNVPNSGYWRQPQNYSKACNFLFAGSFWFATLMTLFFSGLHYLEVKANHATPVTLDNQSTSIFVACLLLGSGVWIVSLVLFFTRNVKKD